MQPEIDAQLSNFFEETTPREFARVMRGYDPHQVDEYFKQLDGEVRQHREQVQALQQELSDAHRQIREQERPTYAGLGSRIEQLLRLAEEQATEIAQEARSAANELNAAAKVDAAEVRAAAENEAGELRANAKRETDELRASAEREADAIKTGARREADELTLTTEREVAKLRATADHEVAEKRASIERDIAKLRTTTEREVAQLKASAKRERDEILTTSKRQADEMRSQAQRILEESEAQRAQAEGEFEIQLASRREEAERQEAERLAAAQSATQKLVSEAEQRAATAEQRAAKASAQAEQTRREADQHSRQLVTNAKKNADQIVAQAKSQAEQLLADTKAEIERHRAGAQREVNELSKQKESISTHLAQISQLLGNQMPGLADALQPRQQQAVGTGAKAVGPAPAAPAPASSPQSAPAAPPRNGGPAAPAPQAATRQAAQPTQQARPPQGAQQARRPSSRCRPRARGTTTSGGRSSSRHTRGVRARTSERWPVRRHRPPFVIYNGFIQPGACARPARPRSGHRGLAAVDHQHLAGHVRGGLAGQEDRGAGHLLRPGPPVHRHRGDRGLPGGLVFPEVAVQLGRGPAGAQRVDPDAAGRPLDGERLGQRDQARLGRAVRGQERCRAHPGHGRDVDDRAAAPFRQVLADRVAHVHGRVEVQPDQLVPAGQPEIQERHHEAGPAGVVHHDVQVAQLVDRPRHRGLHRFLHGDVGGKDEGLPAQRGDLRRGLGQPVLTPGHQGQVRPGPGQGDRDRLPDPPGGAGDESFLARQVEERHAQSFHSVGSGAAAGFTRRTISFSTIRT